IAAERPKPATTGHVRGEEALSMPPAARHTTEYHADEKVASDHWRRRASGRSIGEETRDGGGGQQAGRRGARRPTRPRAYSPSAVSSSPSTTARRIRVQHLADFPGQSDRIERLLQERAARFWHAMARDGVVSVTGHEQDEHLGPILRQPFGQLP